MQSLWLQRQPVLYQVILNVIKNRSVGCIKILMCEVLLKIALHPKYLKELCRLNYPLF